MLKYSLILALGLGAAGLAPAAGVDLDYKDGSTKLQGYLVKAAGKDKVPGVVIVHQWMGLTDYEKGRAEQLSKELGVTVLAADIYGKGVRATDMKSAGELSGKYKANRPLYRQRVKAAVDALAKQDGVDASKLAVIGYCFGGTGALEAARANLPVKGVVCFHGALDSPGPDKDGIQAKILILHGAMDKFSSPEQIAAMKQEFDDAKADWQMTLYSGAVHAFTQPMAGNDPSTGIAYNASADKRSWQAMKDFLGELFPSASAGQAL